MVVVNVEAWELHQRNSWIELGVGLASQHFYVVPKVNQGFGKMADIYALATDVGLTPIGE